MSHETTQNPAPAEERKPEDTGGEAQERKPEGGSDAGEGAAEGEGKASA